MSRWPLAGIGDRLIGRRPIVARLVLAVAAAMAVVLACSAAFVYWRVSYALSHQLDRDLDAYREVAESAIKHGQPIVSDTPGLSYQVFDSHGRLVQGDADHQLVSGAVVRDVATNGTRSGDVGQVIPPSLSYRWVAARVQTPDGTRVAAYAISRHNHDEALRELLLQLVIVDSAILLAVSFVGYRTARAALDPVERYRRTAVRADEGVRLQVGTRDDELSRLGHTFNELLDRITASAERERQFLADASHELRGPLTVMRAEVDLARLRQGEDSATREALDSLGAQIARLVTLCNTLLDLEELRAEPLAAGDVVALRDVTDAVVSRWRAHAALVGRQVVADVPDLTVRGRVHWLDLALDNLVSNAFRYGSGEVRIGATATADGRTELWVEDDGEGFPAEFVGRAFDRFARADESRSSGGTGLGLALVAAVADTHHGSTGIEGSRVTITLQPAG